MKNYYIGYDNGTLGTKVAIYSDDSTLIATAYRAHKIDYPNPGWAEMDPEQFYDHTIDAVRECIDRSKINPKNVKGISCSGVICGFVPIDDNWKPVGPYFPYLDGRATEIAEFVSSNIEPLWKSESGNTIVGSFIPPMILKWLLENQKEMIKNTKKIVTGSQYVMGKLGGLKSKDAYIDWAHLSGWVIGFDGNKRNWSAEQLKLLKIPTEILPVVKKPWDIIGYLSGEAALSTGLQKGIPLVAGAGDMQQSCLGSGVIDLGECSDIAATASNLNVAVDSINNEITSQKVFMYAMDTIGDYFLAWCVVPGGGLSLKWFKEDIMWQAENEKFFEEFDRLIKDIPAGAKGVLFLPFLQGRTNPVWPNASAGWLGLYGSHNSSYLWRSILESIVFEYLTWLNILRKSGLEPVKIVGQGGGSKSQTWNQIKADILNIPYITLEGSEYTVLGNALLAAYGVGDIKDLRKTAKEWVKVKNTFKPEPDKTLIYNKIYNQREKILNGPVKEIYNMLTELKNIEET
jgi:xylulokinase